MLMVTQNRRFLSLVVSAKDRNAIFTKSVGLEIYVIHMNYTCYK